jgi:hypothetical protein
MEELREIYKKFNFRTVRAQMAMVERTFEAAQKAKASVHVKGNRIRTYLGEWGVQK